MSASAVLAEWMNAYPVIPTGNLNQVKDNATGVADWAIDHTWKPSPSRENSFSDELAGVLNGSYGGIALTANNPMALKDGVGGRVTWDAALHKWVVKT